MYKDDDDNAMLLSTLYWRTVCFRKFSGLLLTVIYAVISLTPLAPMTLHAKTVLHAVTGECVGDCAVCGCSPESRANGTCCCAQKRKLQQDRALTEADSSKTAMATSVAVPTEKRSCCIGKKVEHANDEREANVKPAGNKTTTVLKCGCPCGSGKLFALLTTETTQHLPFLFTGGTVFSPEQSPLTFLPQDRLTSRYIEQPEPPPQNS